MKDSLIQRVRAEIDIVLQDIGGASTRGSRVQAGRVTVGNIDYLGVIVRDLGVNPVNFGGVMRLNVLVLLPPDYPNIPPLGIYVDRPYNAKAGNFVRKGYHGAPSLNEKGWYWFCSAIGEFEQRQMRAVWKPAANP